MRKLFACLLISSLIVSCVKDDIDNNDRISTHSEKIINWGDNAAHGHLLVRLAEGVETIEVEGIELDVESLFPKPTSDNMLSRWKLVRFDESLDIKAIAEAIAKDCGVELVEFDIPIKRIKSETMPMPTSRPEPTRAEEMPFNDPELPWQWHYYNDGSLSDYADNPNQCLAGADINLLNAWKYTAGDNRVVVAVMDGGIMTDHPDLADNMWVNEAEKNGVLGIDDDSNGYVDDIYGYNFVNNTGKITADSHGTHVAGTIGAVNNNDYAVCGIAGGTGVGDGIKLMSLQIFEGDDSCYQHQIAQAFTYAADNGAVLINNSWGYEPGGYTTDNDFKKYDGVLKDAIDYFHEQARLEGVMEGGLAIFAAGNDAYHTSAYPGGYYDYICVTAMSSDYTAAYYTNYGPGCNISAPGGDAIYGTLFCISSTSTNLSYGYEYMQGTSMATPHVTGCAALALSYALKQGYSLTKDELKHLILTSTHDINQYQKGSKVSFDYEAGGYFDLPLNTYVGKLGTGYIDAHLLLMQIENTPCIYIEANSSEGQSVANYFGDGSESLTYTAVEMSSADMANLGISTAPAMVDGKLVVNATKRGTGRISITAIAGGESVGGGDNMGGMEVTREFELVVRKTKSSNGGWL